MSQVTEIRSALRGVLAAWDLGVAGLKWRGDVAKPKTDAAEDSPADDETALPMAGVSLPRIRHQTEDHPEILAPATETNGALLHAGDADADAQIVFYVETEAAYQALLSSFPRVWRWAALDSSGGSTLVVPMVVAGRSTELRANLGEFLTLAQPSSTQSRALWVVSWDVMLRFEDLAEDPVVDGHGPQYVRVTINGGAEFGPAEPDALQVEQDETDLEWDPDADSWTLDLGA